MSNSITLETITEAVSKVEHPEIAATLMELGMLRDFSYDPEENAFAFTLVVPFFGIPQTIRDYLINSVAQAAHKLGVKKFRVTIDQMTEEERARFVEIEHKKWRAGGEPGTPQM